MLKTKPSSNGLTGHMPTWLTFGVFSNWPIGLTMRRKTTMVPLKTATLSQTMEKLSKLLT